MLRQMEDYKDEAIKMVQNDWKKHRNYAISDDELILNLSDDGKELIVENIRDYTMWTITAVENFDDYETFLHMRSYWLEPEETKQEVEHKED